MTTHSSTTQQRVLVIGSEGFIGQHLATEFRSQPDRFEVVTCDVLAGADPLLHCRIDPEKVEYGGLFDTRPFDICVNCSGAASVGDSLVNPRRDFELNVGNVVRMLDAIRASGSGCRFLNLSSAAVYGNPAVLPIAERSEARPISPYGLHKLQAEQLCTGYARLFGLRTCSVRIFSAYGPGLRKQLFWDLHNKAQQQSDVVELWGTGDESRDFIEVSDLCRALRLVCERSMFEGEVINVASGKQVTINEAVRCFIAFYAGQHDIAFNGKVKEGDPRNWCADIEKLRSFGFEPEVSIEQGLRRYVDWVKASEP